MVHFMNDVLVSISCITYNHEDYISEAIESFLAQKTNFKYEILIHDDASTDNTVEIIKQYERTYPEIIKPIYQKENKYSRGIKVGSFYLNRALGKYIAICEGDDYWVDPYKLQKQVDYMEAHPECNACVHAALKVAAKTKEIIGTIRPSKSNRNYNAEEVILGGGGFFATNSILHRNSFNQLPKFYYKSPVGDYPLIIYLAINSDVYYMDEFMSAYRVGVINSWSSKLTQDGIESKTKHFKDIELMLNEVNEYSNYKYNEAIKTRIEQDKFSLLVLKREFREIKIGALSRYYKSLTKKQKFMLMCQQYLPALISIYKLYNKHKKLRDIKRIEKKVFNMDFVSKRKIK